MIIIIIIIGMMDFLKHEEPLVAMTSFQLILYC